jgi:hypothetical protein
MGVRKIAMTKLLGFAAPAMFVTLVAWVGGCSSDPVCAYNEKTYVKGESFPAADGCNTCSCVAQGQVECTLMGCLGDAGFKPPSDPAAPDARDAAIDSVSTDLVPASDTGGPDGGMPVDGGARDAYCHLPMALTFYPMQETRVANSIASYTEMYRLDSNALVITRSVWNGYDAEVERLCRPSLPLCGLTDQVTLWNIGADLADPDVKTAFAGSSATSYGAAPWPSYTWSITSDAGGSMLVGQPCPSPDAGTCTPIPPGIQHLRDDLQALAAAGAAQPSCVEALKP